jgi:hypothetical protein
MDTSKEKWNAGIMEFWNNDAHAKSPTACHCEEQNEETIS